MEEQKEFEAVKYEDKNVPCIDCPENKTFIWEAGEQEFYHRNDLHAPTRCPQHRKIKSQMRRQQAEKGSYDRSRDKQPN